MTANLALTEPAKVELREDEKDEGVCRTEDWVLARNRLQFLISRHDDPALESHREEFWADFAKFLVPKPQLALAGELNGPDTTECLDFVLQNRPSLFARAVTALNPQFSADGFARLRKLFLGGSLDMKDAQVKEG